MFGELIGLWLAQVWMDQGAPGDAILLELGPGRGTLMADALRATRAVPGFHAAMEPAPGRGLAPTCAQVRPQTLAGSRAVFHDTLDTLPEKPAFAIANEFFDALPIRQFQRAEGPPLARTRRGDREATRLAIGLAPPAPLAPSNTACPTPPPA
jgi:NADH dehydrogenase [ubiquinone] 1 alpha subcomplex assembly factor 7